MSHHEHQHHHAGTAHDHGPSPARGVKNPVCGMTVDPETARYRESYGGEDYVFCSDGCRSKFVADPATYVDKESQPSPPRSEPEGTIYTCPMHPQIRQPKPGNCPICGMALEPEVAAVAAGPSDELVAMVAQAQRSRAPIQRLADEVSGWFVPLVIGVDSRLW